MVTGRGGMGSHKHGTSGRPGKSPKLRYKMRLEAERTEIKDKTQMKEPHSSIAELMASRKVR